MMGDNSFQSFFYLCSIIKEIPEANPQKKENDEHLVQSLKEKITDQTSMVRQVPNDDEEFYQVHLDIFYKPTSENAEFRESIWDEDPDENIFDYIRNSEVFADAKDKEYLKVKIYLDETQ